MFKGVDRRSRTGPCGLGQRYSWRLQDTSARRSSGVPTFLAGEADAPATRAVTATPTVGGISNAWIRDRYSSDRTRARNSRVRRRLFERKRKSDRSYAAVERLRRRDDQRRGDQWRAVVFTQSSN